MQVYSCREMPQLDRLLRRQTLIVLTSMTPDHPWQALTPSKLSFRYLDLQILSVQGLKPQILIDHQIVDPHTLTPLILILQTLSSTLTLHIPTPRTLTLRTLTLRALNPCLWPRYLYSWPH